MNSQITFKTVGGVTLHGSLLIKNTAHANILQQSDNNNIFYTNYKLKNIVYGFKFI